MHISIYHHILINYSDCMKIQTLTILLCLGFTICLGQTFVKKQTVIPLNNSNGVPYYIDPDLNDYGIKGFDVDSKGDFYFFAGLRTGCLAVFSGITQKYRQCYANFPANELYVYKDSLYTFFKNDSGVNRLIKLNAENGLPQKNYNHLTSKYIDGYKFADGSLILGYYDNTEDSLKEKFAQYALNGKFMKRAPGEFNVPATLAPEQGPKAICDYVGRWKGNYVYWSVPMSKLGIEKLYLVDKTGKVLASGILPRGFSGDGFADNPGEDRKVRNDSFYVLGRKGKLAVITEVPLADLFATSSPQ